MDKNLETLIDRTRSRVSSKTLIQDVSQPLTGEIDRRKLAAKLANVEHAVDELADAVQSLAAKAS
ncbi:MAG: hypothetical protein NVSMB64_29110 [Candidatus Velthaea sp.]